MDFMNTAHLASLDLNLLLVLHVLLGTRSTTEAAQKLGRTQSAVSHALRRLRDVLGDPLFVRTGGTLTPTTFAASLADAVASVLDASDEIFRGPKRALDPKRLEQTFSIGSTDLFGLTVLPHLVETLRTEAPGVNVDLRALGEEPMEAQLERREIDVAFGTRFKRAGLCVVEVGLEDMVVVMRRSAGAARRALTLDAYCGLDHILVAPRGQPGSAIDSALAPLGRSRRVVLRVPHFAAAVLVASRSDLVTTIPRSFARALRGIAAYGEVELPLPSPVFPFQIAYARAREGEPALAWFASRVGAACGAAFTWRASASRSRRSGPRLRGPASPRYPE
jgi:DNA-binding transcriptional LysR family regulator